MNERIHELANSVGMTIDQELKIFSSGVGTGRSIVMNELIDEFAFNAGCNRHKYWDPKHPELEGFIISQAVLDKFAELIVSECAEIAREHMQLTEGIDHNVHDKIKSYFGITE